MKKRRLAKFILLPIFGIGLVSLVVFIVMSLWNWLIPELFNGPVIDFWKAGGILILSKILFGFGKGKHCHRCGGGPGFFWKNKMKEKWNEKLSNLSSEEREKMKDKWKNCWWGDDKHNSTPKVD